MHMASPRQHWSNFRWNEGRYSMNFMPFEGNGLDAADMRILRILLDDARTSVAEIARAVGMSAPSVSERMKRLEENGTIEGYAVTINPAALGLPLGAWLRVRPVPGELARVAEICFRRSGDRHLRPRHRRGLLHRPRAGPFDHRPRAGDRPHHPVRHDQHRDHPVLAGAGPAADAGGAEGVTMTSRSVLGAPSRFSTGREILLWPTSPAAPYSNDAHVNQ